MSQAVYFVDELTLWTWVSRVIPSLHRKRFSGKSGEFQGYAFEGSYGTFALIRFLARWAGGPFERLAFRLLDIRDEEGVLFRLRIPSQDLLEVQAEIWKDPGLQAFLIQCTGMERLPTYLRRAISSYHLLESGTLWRVLQMIQVCVWKMKQKGLTGQAATLFLKRQPFFEAIQAYGLKHGISVVPLRPSWDVRKFLRRLLGPEGSYRLMCLQALMRQKKVNFQKPVSGPRMAVEYLGNLHFNRQERHSDLFFWKPSDLPASHFLITFNTGFRLDDEKLGQISQAGMAAVAVDPRSAGSPKAPVFFFRRRRKNFPLWPAGLRSSLKGLEARWLKEHVSRYLFLRSLWQEFFASNQVKIFVSWFKYTSEHCAIADALQAAGGISVIYQRAYESHPSIETTTAVDIVFAFSPLMAELERRSRSVIRYHVATGYLGDHRFPLVRQEALQIRQRLMQRGAERIVSFTDENSRDDDRWNTGHGLQREHYVFLLEKVLSQPWLGLVVKPKIPSTLRRRLGTAAAKLLEEAQKTGRCFVFEEGRILSAYPPAAAALASDLMIQGHLCAGTTGMESALAGVPTLLLDREGWPGSPLYRLGLGRVVFTDWPSLWKQCMEHWTRPGGVPGFGDWSPILDELDPFRDGRAAERMGVYLRWLLDGFKAGLDRETVMADAAQRYTTIWGKDKVREVGGGAQRDGSSASMENHLSPEVVLR